MAAKRGEICPCFLGRSQVCPFFLAGVVKRGLTPEAAQRAAWAKEPMWWVVAQAWGRVQNPQAAVQGATVAVPGREPERLDAAPVELPSRWKQVEMASVNLPRQDSHPEASRSVARRHPRWRDAHLPEPEDPRLSSGVGVARQGRPAKPEWQELTEQEEQQERRADRQPE